MSHRNKQPKLAKKKQVSKKVERQKTKQTNKTTKNQTQSVIINMEKLEKSQDFYQNEDQLSLDKLHHEEYMFYKDEESNLLQLTKQLLNQHYETFLAKQPQLLKKSHQSHYQNFLDKLDKLSTKAKENRNYYTDLLGGKEYLTKSSHINEAEQKFKQEFLSHFGQSPYQTIDLLNKFEKLFYERQAKSLRHLVEQQNFTQKEQESHFLLEKNFLKDIDHYIQLVKDEKQLLQAKEAQTLLELHFYKQQALQIDKIICQQHIRYINHQSQQTNSEQFLEKLAAYFQTSPLYQQEYQQSHKLSKKVFLTAIQKTVKDRITARELIKFRIQNLSNWVQTQLQNSQLSEQLKNQLTSLQHQLLNLLVCLLFVNNTGS